MNLRQIHQNANCVERKFKQKAETRLVCGDTWKFLTRTQRRDREWTKSEEKSTAWFGDISRGFQRRGLQPCAAYVRGTYLGWFLFEIIWNPPSTSLSRRVVSTKKGNTTGLWKHIENEHEEVNAELRT